MAVNMYSFGKAAVTTFIKNHNLITLPRRETRNKSNIGMLIRLSFYRLLPTIPIISLLFASQKPKKKKNRIRRFTKS